MTKVPATADDDSTKATPSSVSDAAAATTGAAVLSGSLWNGLNRILPQIYLLIMSVVAARILGPTGMGQQSYIAFVELSVAMVLTGGLPTALMRYIGETLGRGTPGAVRSLLAWAWRIEIIAAATGTGILFVVGLTRSNLRSSWLLAAAASGLFILMTLPQAVLIGAQRWRTASTVGLTTGSLGTVSTVLVLRAHGGIPGMFAVDAAVAAVNVVWMGTLARRVIVEIAPSPQPPGDLRSKVARYAALSSLNIIVSFVVWRRTEFFFLEHYSTATQIALYSISYAAVGALFATCATLQAVISPAVATLLGAGEMTRIRTAFARVMRLTLIAALPLTAGVVAVGPPAIRAVYGYAYRGTGPVLVVMMLFFPVLALVLVSNGLLIGLGKVRLPLLFGAFGALVNVIMDFVLIPGHAAVGAALANGIGQMSVGIPTVVYACYLARPMDWAAGTIAKGIAAAGACGVAASVAIYTLGNQVGIPVGVVAGVVIFAGLVRLLRVVAPHDAVWLQDTVGVRFGRSLGRALTVLLRTPRDGS